MWRIGCSPGRPVLMLCGWNGTTLHSHCECPAPELPVDRCLGGHHPRTRRHCQAPTRRGSETEDACEQPAPRRKVVVTVRTPTCLQAQGSSSGCKHAACSSGQVRLSWRGGSLPTAMSRSRAPTQDAMEMPASASSRSTPTIEYVPSAALIAPAQHSSSSCSCRTERQRYPTAGTTGIMMLLCSR